jgi:preprotein translocase SecE subunit
MSFGMYKQGQGYWTRMMTFIGGSVIFAWGGAWLAAQVSKIDFAKNPDGSYVTMDPRYWQLGAGVTTLLIGVVLCYWLAYVRHASGEFLIATEGEMKKVNWSSRKEIMGSTWVVVGISVLLSLCLFLVDLGFSNFFQFIDILERPS